MDNLKSGWLKFYRVFDAESRDEVKKDIQRHWFILRHDGLLFHSKKKAKVLLGVFDGVQKLLLYFNPT